MYLKQLSLTNFRNFSRLDLDVPSGPVVLVGGNAQGKTSLLEAVYFLATFSSFQAGSDRQLISFLAARDALAVGRIVADFVRGDREHQIEVRIIQEANGVNGSTRVRKEILIDGTRRKMNEAVGQFNAVLFLPQMLKVVDGSPGDRRRYLNLALAQTVPGYAAALSAYDKALSQRNALLKLLGERNGDPDQLVFWDEQITFAGALLIEARIQAVHQLEALASTTHRELTRGEEALRLVYQPAYDPLPAEPNQISLPMDAQVDRSGLSREQIESGFKERLMEIRQDEIARGQTLIGPHRDEVRFLANGIDLGTYGSRGQVRTTMLSMKMAEVSWMHQRTGEYPVLLLDEVLAELDPTRRLDLQERLVESEQALLTTTDLDLFTADFKKNAAHWQVEQGTINPQK